MRRKKILIHPVLRDRKGDLSKKWYVEFSQRNPKTDEMFRKRFETFDDVNINVFKTAAERYDFANKILPAEKKEDCLRLIPRSATKAKVNSPLTTNMCHLC